MRAVFIERFGEDAPLRFGEVPERSCGPDDLVVEVRAASLNPVDLRVRAGDLQRLHHYRLPLRLGSDVSGVVTKLGERVTDFEPGDEVFARLPKDRLGAFAERVTLPAAVAARKPARLDHVQAAGVPLAGLTALQALRWAELASGQRVLVHAGSGGVGTFAIQLARHLGATVVTTVGARNEELVRSLGAGHVIDYRTTRFDEVLAGTAAVDVVFDTQGGDTLYRSFSVVRPGGGVVTIGGRPTASEAVAAGQPSLITRLFLHQAHRRTRSLARRHDARFRYLFMVPSGRQLAELATLIEQGRLTPVIDRTYPLEAAAEAFAHVASGHATGKVVLRAGGN